MPKRSAAVVDNGAPTLRRISEKDREKAIELIRSKEWDFKRFSPQRQHDRELVLATVRHHGSYLHDVPDVFKNDVEIVGAAVASYGEALEFAAAFKNDKNIVAIAVDKDGAALQYASDELRADEEIVLKALKQNPQALQWAAEPLRDQRNTVVQAISGDGQALKFASKAILADREIVSLAVAKSPEKQAWQYAVQPLRDELLRTAVRGGDAKALQFASAEMLADIGYQVLEDIVKSSSSQMSVDVLVDLVRAFPGLLKHVHSSKKNEPYFQNIRWDFDIISDAKPVLSNILKAASSGSLSAEQEVARLVENFGLQQRQYGYQSGKTYVRGF